MNLKKFVVGFVFVCFGVFALSVGVYSLVGLAFSYKAEAAEVSPEQRLREREVRALERIATYVEDIGLQMGNLCFELPPLPLCKPRPVVKP